jgi:hypothetical protein
VAAAPENPEELLAMSVGSTELNIRAEASALPAAERA